MNTPPTFTQVSLRPVLQLKDCPAQLCLNASPPDQLMPIYQALLADERIPVHQPEPGDDAAKVITHCLENWSKSVSEKLHLELHCDGKGFKATLHVTAPEAVPIYRGVRAMRSVHARLAATFMAMLRPQTTDVMRWYLPEQAYRETFPDGERAMLAKMRQQLAYAEKRAISPAEARRILRKNGVLLPSAMRSQCLGLHRPRQPLSTEELRTMPMPEETRANIHHLLQLGEDWRWLMDSAHEILEAQPHTFWGTTLGIIETERFGYDESPNGWGLIEETHYEKHGGTAGEAFTLILTPQNTSRLIDLTHLMHDMVTVGEQIAYELMMFEDVD